jgi:hypothetical protein
MTSSKIRKTVTALVAAATIGLALSPTGASAAGGHHHHGRGFGYGAAAFGGALLLGSIIASSTTYARECWIENRKRYDADGYPYFTRVRICD